jgi:hypothetical protein
MPTLSSLKQILQQWEQMKLKKGSRKGLFFKSNSHNPLDQLVKSLNDYMTIKELAHSLSLIESLRINSQSTFGNWLGVNGYRIMEDLGVNTQVKPSKPVLSTGTPQFNFLIKLHDILLNYYEAAKLHAKGELPTSEIQYDQDQLQESQAFYDLETTTQQEESRDQSTSIPDFKRKGVTILGNALGTGNSEGDEDTRIVEGIEAFTQDKIASPNSRASKIFHFGGQFLEAIVLKEFSNTMKLDGSDAILEAGYSRSYSNWTKDPHSNQLFATINVKVFTCGHAASSEDSPQKLLTVGSDGRSLIEIGSEDLEKVMKQCKAEITKNREIATRGNVVPMCELTARIQLTENEAKTGYMLKMKHFTTRTYTADLVSSKAKPLNSLNNIF